MNDVDILYDQVVHTDLEVGANCPHLVIKDKRAKKDICSRSILPMQFKHIQSRGNKDRKIQGVVGATTKNVGV